VLVLVPGQPMCTSIPPDPRMTRDLISVPRDHRQVQQPAELSAARGA
jgi:hypothetical protein